MLKGIKKCQICGKIADRDELVVYNFPTGPKLVCKKCYRTLPPDPMKGIPRPDKKTRGPHDDLFPPVG